MATAKLIGGLIALACYVCSVNGEQCIPGPHHMKTSAPATKDYAECLEWSKNTCCPANFTQELDKNHVKNLYNFHWAHCKNISQACEKYILAEECFYSCEPRLINWLEHAANATVRGVPVCGDYCDEWYKACENDQTCVADWQVDFNFTNNVYTCPKNSTCKTFKEMYGSGEKLCNTMWGKSFVYVHQKSCPCTRLDRPIPNNVNYVSTCSGGLPSSPHLTFKLFFLFLGVGIKLFHHY